MGEGWAPTFHEDEVGDFPKEIYPRLKGEKPQCMPVVSACQESLVLVNDSYFPLVNHLLPFSFYVILGTDVAVLTHPLQGWTPDPFLANGNAASP